MMDRRLKERLVGATILVALIVLIVPELLSGPKRPTLPPLAAGLPAAPSRSVVVDLDTRKAIAEPDSAAASQAAPGRSAECGRRECRKRCDGSCCGERRAGPRERAERRHAQGPECGAGAA